MATKEPAAVITFYISSSYIILIYNDHFNYEVEIA